MLHVALERGFPTPIFANLLRHGADPDLEDARGRTVREIAARKRDPRWAELLAKRS